MINLESPPRSASRRQIACGTAAVLLLLAVSLKGFASEQAPAGAAQEEQSATVHTDYVLPPSTLDAAWGKVPIIVLARVQSSAARERVGPRGVRVPFTEHQVNVLEVFKGAELIGPSKTLLVNQATVEKGITTSGVAHESGGRLFRASEVYVLFLERLAGTALGVAWGAGGAYRVGAMTVDVPGVSQRMWGFREEITPNELLSALRAKRDKSHANK